MATDRTDRIENPTLTHDVLKTSQSASQFGPTRIYRVSELPPDSFGRNGDMVIIDNTAVETTEITEDQIPTNVGFCQKVPTLVPSGPNSASTPVGGADLTGSDSFTINGNTVTLPAGAVFINDAEEAINAAAIPGISATSNNTCSNGTVVNPMVLPGDSLIINGTNIIFPKNGGIGYIIAEIKAAAIPFISVAQINNRIVISHTRGGTLTFGGANLAAILGAPVVGGGVLTLLNDAGTQVDLVDVVGTPVATMGLPGTIAASALTQGGTWECFASSVTAGIAVEDNNVPIGTFTTFDFSGAGVTLTDLGSGELGIAITGGAGGLPGTAITVINGQPTLTLVDTTRSNKILSVAENNLIFAENILTQLDWVRIANANDADSGYIMDLNGTIVFGTGHCEDTAANSADIHLFINGVDQGNIGTLSGGANATFVNTTMDFDFSQGDRIRLQAQSVTGTGIQDTTIKITVKWRG